MNQFFYLNSVMLTECLQHLHLSYEILRMLAGNPFWCYWVMGCEIAREY